MKFGSRKWRCHPSREYYSAMRKVGLSIPAWRSPKGVKIRAIDRIGNFYRTRRRGGHTPCQPSRITLFAGLAVLFGGF
jgi:hypothetical protein